MRRRMRRRRRRRRMRMMMRMRMRVVVMIMIKNDDPIRHGSSMPYLELLGLLDERGLDGLLGVHVLLLLQPPHGEALLQLLGPRLRGTETGVDH
jgi:hypothetical protein